MYNNYFSCTGNYYCSNARTDVQILSEHNYYDHVNNPIYADADKNGLIKTVGNIYDSCTGKIAAGTDTVFIPSYSYTLDTAEDVPAMVIAGAGTLLYGDYNGDESVDGDDLARFVDIWLRPAVEEVFYLDLNADGAITLYEFSRLAENWLAGH